MPTAQSPHSRARSNKRKVNQTSRLRTRPRDGGSSFRMIVHLDPKGIRSWSALPYGNSQDPANPHYADQQAMFGRGEYKDTLYGVKRIQAGAVAHVTLRTE